MFYDRVSESLTLQARRLDGNRQRQYLVPNPDFYPNIPPTTVLAGNRRDLAMRMLDQALRSPYTAQFALSVERQFPKNTTLSVTYASARGVHMLRSRNINAPLPGTYDSLAPGSGIRPFDGGNLFLYESTGLFRQNQIIVNLNARLSQRLNLFGYYTWNRANSDTDAASNFPANQYALTAEYGRASFDIRHRAFLGGSIQTPYGLMFSPFITANSGPPFNITIGRDLNGDSIFNDRPTWATDLNRASVVHTAYGAFDSSPQLEQSTIGRNVGNGPGQFTVNLRLSKSFAIGKEGAKGSNQPQAAASPSFGGPGGSGGRGGHGGMHGMGSASSNGRYSLTFSVSARNLFNTVNRATPIGNLSSPVFGTSIATAGRSSANRTLDFQVRFAF